MKKIFLAAAFIVAIIVVRMILSVTLSEQAAEVFSRVSIGVLFFYCILMLSKNRLKSAN